MLLYCSHCGYEPKSTKEYIMHKKDSHGTRVNDSIDSLQTIGFDDPQVYAELREQFRNEKYNAEWKKNAKEQLREHLRQNDFLWDTKIPLR